MSATRTYEVCFSDDGHRIQISGSRIRVTKLGHVIITNGNDIVFSAQQSILRYARQLQKESTTAGSLETIAKQLRVTQPIAA